MFEWARPSPARRVSLGNQPSACPQAVLAGPGPPLTHTHTHTNKQTHTLFLFFCTLDFAWLLSRKTMHKLSPPPTPPAEGGGASAQPTGLMPGATLKTSGPSHGPPDKNSYRESPATKDQGPPKHKIIKQTNTHTHTNKYLVPTAAARVTRGSIPIQCYCFVFPVRFGRGVASAKYPCFWASSPAQGRPQALPGTTRKTEYQH